MLTTPSPISCSFYSPQTSQDLYSGGILFAFLSNKCLFSSLVAGPGLEGHKWVISCGTEGRGWGRGGRESPTPELLPGIAMWLHTLPNRPCLSVPAGSGLCSGPLDPGWPLGPWPL